MGGRESKEIMEDMEEDVNCPVAMHNYVVKKHCGDSHHGHASLVASYKSS